MFETPFDLNGADNLLNATLSCVISRGDASANFVISNHFATALVETPLGTLPLPDQNVAAEVNTKANIQNRLDSCQSIFRRNANLLAVDFWSIGDVLEVVDENNAGVLERR
jgi:hypothetical protein